MVEPLSARDDFLRGVAAARADERERCALLAEALATILEASAAKIRKEGSYTVRALWPLGKLVTCVRPNFERGARDREAAAQMLRNAIVRGCREGWDPRKIKPHEQGMALRTGVDGDPSLVNLDPVKPAAVPVKHCLMCRLRLRHCLRCTCPKAGS